MLKSSKGLTLAAHFSEALIWAEGSILKKIWWKLCQCLCFMKPYNRVNALLVNQQENLNIFCYGHTSTWTNTNTDTHRAGDKALPCSIANWAKIIWLRASARGQLVCRLRPAKYQRAAPPCCLLYSSMPYFLSSVSSPTPWRIVQRHRLALAHFNHSSLPLIHILVAFISPAGLQKLWQCWIRIPVTLALSKQSYTCHVPCMITPQSPQRRIWFECLDTRIVLVS